jgi:hypothetical protein
MAVREAAEWWAASICGREEADRATDSALLLPNAW